MFYQIFLSPQVKRWAIITYEHDIYKLPHELPNDLRLNGQDQAGLNEKYMSVGSLYFKF